MASWLFINIFGYSGFIHPFQGIQFKVYLSVQQNCSHLGYPKVQGNEAKIFLSLDPRMYP